MVLEESLYNPTMPVEERGVGAWDRRQFTPPTAGKRPRETEPSQALNPFRRKLRRSASTKMGSQSEALWAGITAGGVEQTHDEADDWTEDNIAKQDAPQDMPEDDAPPAADPAYDAPLSLLPTANPATGIFQGRIVFPYGFDEQQVNSCPMISSILLTGPLDIYPAATSPRQGRTGPTQQRTQHFHAG